MKKFAFYIILVALPFVLMEVVVRAYFAFRIGPDVWLYGTPYSRQQQTFDPKGSSQREDLEGSTVAFHDNDVGGYSKYEPYQIRNDRDAFGNPVSVSINGRGFRGPDFEERKAPGALRIVSVGASSTFGFRNADDTTYPYLLQRLLSDSGVVGSNSRGETITSIEVINLGIPHLRSEQILALVLKEALALEPDYLTFYEGVNDAAWTPPPETTTERTKEVVKAIPLANEIFRALRYRLLTVALVGQVISQAVSPYASEADMNAIRAGKVQTFLSNLQGIAEACEARGIRLIVASQQATGREGRNESSAALRGVSYEEESALIAHRLASDGRVSTVEAYLMVHKELMDAERQWAMENDILYADVIEAMNGNRDDLVSWVHLNAHGNQIIAQTLARTILEDLSVRARAPALSLN